MIARRTVVTLSMAVTTLALGLVACSSDANSDSGGAGDGVSGGSGNGTSSSGSNASSGGTTSTGKLKQCGGSGGGDESKCTAAERDAYASCIQTSCTDTFKECYGPDYANGTFTGVCGDFMACFNACDCNDTSCYGKCPEPTAACTTCMGKVETCTDKCAVPECMKSAPAAGGKTCADLAACCAAMTDEDEKSACEQAHALAGNSDTSCGAFYGGLCTPQ